MGSEDLRLLTIILMIMCTSKMCAGQNDITVSVFTVTSKSMTVLWSGQSDASSFNVTATPKNSREQPVFTQFSSSTVMGSVNSLSPNTVYTMRVESMNSSVNVLSSAETEETTAPEVPSIVQAYSKHSDSITVEFREVSGATAYILRAENNDGFFSESVVYSSPVVVAPALRSVSPTEDSIVVSWDPVEHAVQYTLCVIMEESDALFKVNTSQTNMTFSSLDPGVTYCIKATAWDPNSIPGDDITIYQITRPPVPAGVQVSLTLERIMGLAVYWEAVRGASLYFALSSMGQNCTSMGDPFCIISPIGCSENHTLTVMAENQAGPSSPSQPKDLLTFPCPPVSVEVDEPSVGNCSVTWTRVPWVEYYMVYINRDDGAEEQCNTTNTICYFHCDCGYTYMTTVFVYNVAGASPPGPILNYTTVPCCPQNVYVSLVSTETLEVTWPAVRGADLYETVAADGSDTLHCTDTVPICALSDLTCNSLYSVVIRPCGEIRGCNNTCTPKTQETAPCAPEILNLTQVSRSAVQVSWRATNKQANYTVNAFGSASTLTCSSTNTSCGITNLPCGDTYEVSVYATTTVGHSLPSYSITMETGPCCPETLSVEQVTQSMTSVKWSSSKGGWSYVTSLSSSRGHAKCHTMDTHCLMGCITCGTNYNVSVEAMSITGHQSLCNYHGFSSSTCCPSGVRLYRMVNNTLRVSWRGSDSVNGYSAELSSNSANYTCRPVLGVSSCDIDSVLCGDTYSVVVAPLTLQGSKVLFCPRRLYSVSCVGNSVGMVIYRGKRSVD
ncbi:fibronectin type III domain-containing protein 7 isoform X2 [Pangasianodon hypophthalmus]|uniref:fibronectin type III domain-containing protein 7 isoform X2 n=1 Tax=Pangasianodon hypophthalmus TaxID=310915 RepID=UPI0014816099|nr:fibronectin type III domain-containing protein 7 isoform X2 [Pangasianodon hypophthalmus]